MNHPELIRTVEWKDLRKLSVKEMLIENNISLPWLFISLFLAFNGYYGLALPFSGFYFLTALRQVHNGFHNSLGTGKTADMVVSVPEQSYDDGFHSCHKV